MSPTTTKWFAVPSRFLPRGAALGALLVTALGSPSAAHASGFLSARYGADHGNPVGDNAYSVYFNPAAIAAAQGTQVTLDAVLVYRLASYERTETSPSTSFAKSVQPGTKAYADYQQANLGKANLGNFLASPFLGMVTDFGKPELPVRAGFAFYIPFGGQSTWDRRSELKSSYAPGGYDGTQRWMTISGRVTSMYLTPAVAVTIPNTGLSIGINGSVVLNTIETVRARNSDGSDTTSSSSGRLLEGRSYVDVKSTTFAGAIGLYYEAIPKKLKFGVSYTVRPGFGQMRLSGKLKTQFGTAPADSQNDVDLLQTYPDVFRFGLGYRVSEQVELRADFNYVNWSVFRRQCLVSGNNDNKCKLYDNGAEASSDNVVIQSLERKWHDAFGVRGSGSYYLSKATELFGSLGYDSSAVPDSTLEASFIDAPKLLGSLGVRQRFGQRFMLGTSYNHVYFFERDTTGKSTLNQLEGDSKQPSSAGKYNQQFFILDVNGTLFF